MFQIAVVSLYVFLLDVYDSLHGLDYCGHISAQDVLMKQSNFQTRSVVFHGDAPLTPPGTQENTQLPWLPGCPSFTNLQQPPLVALMHFYVSNFTSESHTT